MSYLYGASVQGIQEFIMQRSKLANICIADAKVGKVCWKLFDKLLNKNGITSDDYIIIERAAGKVKLVFGDVANCKKIVLEFPKLVMQYAPGITISQAVVEYHDGDYKKAADKLDKKLKIQRNKPARSMTMGLMGIARESTSGLPEIYKEQLDGNGWYEYVKLCKKFFGTDATEKSITRDFGDLKDDISWIAVIHIDGNSLGKIIENISDTPRKLQEFDKIMRGVTTTAAVEAYKTIKEKISTAKIIPIRPLVLGGDDLTVVCRADLAFDFVKKFMAEFENITTAEFCGKDFGRSKLTSCAGIAFVKAKFPYYFAYQLAEKLCETAKLDSKLINKEVPPSCLMFHKVQDSFVESYADIVKREMTINDEETFKFGPYYLDVQTGRWTIDCFVEIVETLGAHNSIKNGIREWITLKLRANNQAAKQRLDRIKQIADNEKEFIKTITEPQEGRYPTYDLLSYCAIQKSRSNRND